MLRPTNNCEHCSVELHGDDRVVQASEPTSVVDASDDVKIVDGAFVYFLEDHWTADTPEDWQEQRRGTLRELRGY